MGRAVHRQRHDGLPILLIGIPVVLVGALLTAMLAPVGIVLLVVSVGALTAIGAACSGVFNAALYRYATTGEASGAFSLDDMNASVPPPPPQGPRRRPGRATGQGFGGGPACRLRRPTSARICPSPSTQ